MQYGSIKNRSSHEALSNCECTQQNNVFARLMLSVTPIIFLVLESEKAHLEKYQLTM